MLDGEVVEATRCLKAGECLELLHDALAGVRAQAAGRPEAPIVIHQVSAESAVVWKPAGGRAAGEYPGTLQSALRILLPPSTPPAAPNDALPLIAPLPVTRIEASCTGLTLVARTRRKLAELEELNSRSALVHAFVAIIHGQAPSEWSREGGAQLELPAKSERGLKKAKRRRESSLASAAAGSGECDRSFSEGDGVHSMKESERGEEARGEGAGEEEAGEGEEEGEDVEEDVEETAANAGAPSEGLAIKAEVVHVAVLSATDDQSPVPLTTVRLECGGRHGRLCGDLCFLMRRYGLGTLIRTTRAFALPTNRVKLACVLVIVPHRLECSPWAGVPVVGDRYARRERGSLPRYCASLKAKAQILCLGVRAPTLHFELPVPPRMLAQNWSSQEAASRSRSAADEATNEALNEDAANRDDEKET